MIWVQLFPWELVYLKPFEMNRQQTYTWANHIQTNHSQCPILRPTQLPGQPEKKFDI